MVLDSLEDSPQPIEIIIKKMEREAKFLTHIDSAPVTEHPVEDARNRCGLNKMRVGYD